MTIVTLVLIFSVMVLFFKRVNEREWFLVSGNSMQPVLFDGDAVLVEKTSYRFHFPRRFDVIVFEKNGQIFVKRIIGLPGETVRICEGEVWINETKLDEGRTDKIEDSGTAEFGVYLGQEEYFVLGDNRSDSLDSRRKEIGKVKKEEIIGRAVLPK